MIQKVRTLGDRLGCRQLFGMTKKPNKKGIFVLFGGYNHQKKEHYDSLYSYESSTRTLTKILPDCSKVSFGKIREASVNFRNDDRVIIYGGKIDCSLYTGKNSSDILYSFNLKTKVLRKLKSNLPFISGHDSLYWKEKDSLVIYGGWDSIKNECLNDIIVHSFKTRKLHRKNAIGVPPKPRSLHKILWFITDSSFLLFGGFGKEYYNDIWIFNLRSSKWRQIKSTTNSKPIGRCGMGCVLEGDKLFVLGGFNDSVKQIKDLWSFSFVSNSWREIELGNMICLSYHQVGLKLVEKEEEEEGEKVKNDNTCNIVLFSIGGATVKNKTLGDVIELSWARTDL